MRKLIFLAIISLVISQLVLSQQPRVGGTSKVGGKSKAGRAATGGVNGFTAVKTITIDPTKVSGGLDLTDFPVLFSGTFAYLKTTGNGGDVTDAQGDDIVFTSDSGCTTNLKFEQETYDATTGDVKYHAKIPTVSTSVGTSFYLCYGKSSITTFQGDATNVWTNYAGVWHLKDGTTLSSVNSATNNSGSIVGSTATTGQIDGGAIFGAVSTDEVVTDLTTNANTRTYSIWSFRTGDGGNGHGRLWQKGTSSEAHDGIFVESSFAGGTYEFIGVYNAGGGQGEWSFTKPSINVWHHIVVTYDKTSTANDPLIYVDGSAQTVIRQVAPSGSPFTGTEAYVIGNRGFDDARVFAGSEDEFRISNTILSADWILTEFDNQSSPTTFYSVS